MTHYIGMAGLNGCLPATCYAHESYGDAVEDLAMTHEMGKRKKRELAILGYVQLSLKYHGNEYAEIVVCNCDDPEQHKA